MIARTPLALHFWDPPQVIVAAHEKNLQCAIDIDPEALCLSFISDANRLQQILSNFGWNAAKVSAPLVL